MRLTYRGLHISTFHIANFARAHTAGKQSIMRRDVTIQNVRSYPDEAYAIVAFSLSC